MDRLEIEHDKPAGGLGCSQALRATIDNPRPPRSGTSTLHADVAPMGDQLGAAAPS